MQIVTSGLGSEVTLWLRQRLDGVAIETLDDHLSLLGRVGSPEVSGVVVDFRDIPLAETDDYIRLLTERAPSTLSVICCMDPDTTANLPVAVITELGADRLVFHPIDKEELARHIATALGLTLRALPSALTGADASDLDDAWDVRKKEILNQLKVVETATITALEGTLSDELRFRSELIVHELTATIGAYGFARAVRIAGDIEHILRNPLSPDDPQVFRLSELLISLQQELHRAPVRRRAAQQIDVRENAAILLVCDDTTISEALVVGALARGYQASAIAGVEAARSALLSSPPDLVMVDLAIGDGRVAALDFLEDVALSERAIEIVALSPSDTFIDRLEVARLGGRGFVQRFQPTAQILDAAGRLLEQAGHVKGRVLLIDDKKEYLDQMSVLLERDGFSVTALDDPLRFWATFEETSPEVVVMAYTMPILGGRELVKVLRTDARWAGLPLVLVCDELTQEVINDAVGAGADDVIGRAGLDPELALRVANRLERIRTYRLASETDSLTGVSTRQRSLKLMEQFLKLSDRHGAPVCLGLVDVDGMSQLNRRFGHAAGDQALRRLAELLTDTFRGEDVVARWGDDEFVVCMYDITREVAIHRLAEVLERLREQKIGVTGGGTVTATFSASAAQYPDDGAVFDELFDSASQAVDLARTQGGDRTLPAGWQSDEDEGTPHVDIVVVEDDESLAEVLLHALSTRGYHTSWLRDGQEAAATLTGPRPEVRPRLVILDAGLPGLDGFGVLRKIMERKGWKPRVIMLSATGSEQDVVKALELGAYDHLSKPFSIPVLMQRVRSAMRT